MAEEDDVVELIKSVILSKQGGVYVKDLNDDYKSLAGENIPYLKLGFENIEELVNSINEIEKNIDVNGEVRLISNTKNCQHLRHLIKNQKKTKFPSQKNIGNHYRKKTNFRKSYAEVNLRNENQRYYSSKPKDYRKWNEKSYLEVGNYYRSNRNIKAEKYKSSKSMEDSSVFEHKGSYVDTISSCDVPRYVKEVRSRSSRWNCNSVNEYQNNKQRKYRRAVEKISEYYLDQITNFQQPVSFRKEEIPEYLDLECSYGGFDANHNESEEDYDYMKQHQWTRRHSTRYTKRKVDFIGGSLLVTINSFEN